MTEYLPSATGARITDLREIAGLTIEELAAIAAAGRGTGVLYTFCPSQNQLRKCQLLLHFLG